MNDFKNADEYVRENRKKIIGVIRNSDDAYTRACAWTLLDRYTPDKDIEDLKDELDTIANRGDDE
jgi:hypothetical protein